MWLRKLYASFSGLTRVQGGSVNRRGKLRVKRRATQLRLEVLEDRIHPAVWTGLGTNNLWSNGNNWQGHMSPSAGDSLIFPSGAPRLTNFNDLGFTFNSVTVQDNYSISGSALILTGNLHHSGSPTINSEVIFSSGSSSITPDTTGSELRILSHNLTVQAETSLTINGGVRLTGDLIDQGAVTIGRLVATLPYFSVRATTVAAGASLDVIGNYVGNGNLDDFGTV